MVALQVKPPLTRSASHPEAPVQVPDALLLIQLPAFAIEEAAEAGPRAWAPSAHVGNKGRVPGI